VGGHLSIVFISLCLKHVRSVAAALLRVHLLLYLSCDLIDMCTGVVLKLPVKKLKVFLVLIAFRRQRQFLEHAHKLFDEMSVRT
jgi:hypothetical protein